MEEEVKPKTASSERLSPVNVLYNTSQNWQPKSNPVTSPANLQIDSHSKLWKNSLLESLNDKIVFLSFGIIDVIMPYGQGMRARNPQGCVVDVEQINVARIIGIIAGKRQAMEVAGIQVEVLRYLLLVRHVLCWSNSTLFDPEDPRHHRCCLSDSLQPRPTIVAKGAYYFF
ncbi:hypothetical protein RUM44_008954 [Polyplax serrata]|uniref:Uncharacterized protein n=1 Tax=Polyplax serrata TaxID=468196 RepID=A0ABR1ARY1_POLSC